MSEPTEITTDSILQHVEEIQRLFELCREKHPDEWHTLLRAECAGRDADAFEVLTLLVAAEQVANAGQPHRA